MKVCWFGIYEPSYARNEILISGVRTNDVEVIECRVQGGGIRNYVRLITKLRALKNDYDVLYCGFPVHLTTVVAKLFQRRPIVADAFFPKFEADVHDRKKFSVWHPRAWALWVIDWCTAVIPQHIVVDTEQHAEYWERYTTRKKMSVIPIGANTTIFCPVNDPNQLTVSKSRFIVQYHGSYIPLQGLEQIVEAAHILLKHSDIRFRFIGDGQLYPKITEQSRSLGVAIEFITWTQSAQLVRFMHEATVILGIFGRTNKTDRVVPNKVYEGLAIGKPVISKDTQALRTLFSENEVYMVDNTPEAIAAAILELKNNELLRQSYARHGLRAVEERFTPAKLGAELASVLRHTCDSYQRSLS